MNDRIEKMIELKAPIARVWRALTDHREFGAWFGVRIDAPFVPGQISRGWLNVPGREPLRWEIVVQKIEPERLFSFTSHPCAEDPAEDYSKEPPTLVEFTVEKIAGGTLLRVVESGFATLFNHRRNEAFRRHDSGWDQQLTNIARHVEQAAA